MISKSKSQTQKFAAKIAKKILRPTSYALRPKIIALHGDLGAGKTTFVQGFIKALGVRHHITSPTFLIIRKYPLKSKRLNVKGQMFHNVYHLDLYRIHKLKELLDLGFKKMIGSPENIILIEWPERAGKLLQKNILRINFEHGKNEKERIINVR